MTKPDVRKRLLQLAAMTDAIHDDCRAGNVTRLAMEAKLRLIAAAIRACEVELYNRSPRRRGPRKAVTMTPVLAGQIIAIAAKNPDLIDREIGALVGCDGGRVSEVLAGKRT